MRKLLVVSAAALFACGGSSRPTMTATPAVKQDVTNATEGVKDTNDAVSASVGVQSLGNSIAVAGMSQSVGSVDISGIPDPSSLPKMHPKDLQGSIAALRSTAVTASLSGCIKDDGSGHAIYVAVGTSCSATDHLEVDYSNGDVAWISYSGSDTNFTLSFVVKAGNWTGTSLTYTVTGSQTSGSLSIRISGAMKYAGATPIDTTFDFTYALSGSSASGSSGNFTITYNGTVTDTVGKHKYVGNMSLVDNYSSSSTSIHVTANTDLSLLDSSLAPLHTISLAGFDVTGSTTASGATFTVAGDILWDGAVVGSLKLQDSSHVVIAWTDGTTTPFDPSLLGGFK